MERLDQTNATSEKVALMKEVFAAGSPADNAWTLFFLSGRKLKGVVKRAVLTRAAMDASGLPEWLITECREAVGDTAETLSAILPPPSCPMPEGGLADWMADRILPLARLDEDAQAQRLREMWACLDQIGRFALNKILLGAFRLGVSEDLVYRAAGQSLGMEQAEVARRLMGEWNPSASVWTSLTEERLSDEVDRPVPFALAHPIGDLSVLGSPEDWMAEWKWDGIRCQAVCGSSGPILWSRGEEILNDAFPDVAASLAGVPQGTILDGEVLAWLDGRPMDFASLQKRIGRKNPSKKILADNPCIFLAFDCVAWQGGDIREESTLSRRARLEGLGIPLSPVVPFQTLDDLVELRAKAEREGREGLMLKRKDASYPAGRKTGIWWKWKVAPMTVDAVLVYAQAGSGRRANIFTDYTFALWKDGELAPFAKAYSGLTDEEIRQVDAVIRQTTTERHGPVRVVRPTLVFEIAFENISLSSRHKSGVAVRFPRILRWRQDKEPKDADTIESVLELLRSRQASG